ncbi:MAG: hypothetical protein J6Y37_03695 [Paludibacteraceae bacterium]|nr:hypothetical protein [Paludibacteraceae bacterium]
MANIYDEQLDRMRYLNTYGQVDETAAKPSTVLEYHTKGADGKTYGIVREGHKFYIKVAPEKDTQVLAEDYQYIGGINNKKANEFLTYTVASKQLDMKLSSIREAVRGKALIETATRKDETPSSEWQINETKEMRREINRFNEIVGNVSSILNESDGFTMNHTLPEAPASNPSAKKVNSPFTDTATAELDKDLKDTDTDYKKAGKPYDKDAKPGGEPGKCEGGDCTYSEKPKYVDTGVAGQHPKGGKVAKVNEGCANKTVKITEEQVLAWNKSKDFMDKSHGTEIGSSEPFTDQLDGDKSNQGESGAEPIHEADGTVVHTAQDQGKPKPGTNEVGDSAPFEEGVNESNDDDVPFPEVEDGGSYMGFERDYNQWLDKVDKPISIDLDDDEYGDGYGDIDFDVMKDNPYGDEMEIDLELDDTDDEWGDKPLDDFDDEDDYEDDMPVESRRRMPRRVNETKLDDFGKHPAYQKKVMTTPPNKEIDRWGRDWNDDSAKGEKPYGIKIGDGSPFSEEVIETLVDNVMRKLSGGDKKKA